MGKIGKGGFLCHTSLDFCVLPFCGLYAPRECGTLPLLSVERLVIVRLGKAQQRTAPSGGVPRAIPLGIPVASTERARAPPFRTRALLVIIVVYKKEI